MSSPKNIHWARLKSVKRYLVNLRARTPKFEPSASEARDNELTASSDCYWGRLCENDTKHNWNCFVLKYAGSTIATMSRTQGSISLSSAEAEYNATVSALAEAKQVHEILGEYHADTHITLETDSSAAKANAERPACGRMKHITIKYRYLHADFTNQEVWLRKVGTKNNTKSGSHK